MNLRDEIFCNTISLNAVKAFIDGEEGAVEEMRKEMRRAYGTAIAYLVEEDRVYQKALDDVENAASDYDRRECKRRMRERAKELSKWKEMTLKLIRVI